MSDISICHHRSRIGELVLGVFDDQLCLLDFRYRRMRVRVDQRLCTGLQARMVEGTHPLLARTVDQVEAYLDGQLKAFDLPLLTVGSEFQKQVWSALLDVPYGRTASYATLAERIGRPAAVRAVASANGANAISLIIPCHRIIGKNGELVGYGGGLAAKKRLLSLEGALHSTSGDRADGQMAFSFPST